MFGLPRIDQPPDTADEAAHGRASQQGDRKGKVVHQIPPPQATGLTRQTPQTDAPITPADFRFSMESPDGRAAASRRVGADTGAVGPGSGSREWQSTAAANEWSSLWRDG